MIRNESKVETGDPLFRVVDQIGSELCWLAFLITGSWQTSVEAVVSIFDVEGIDRKFCPERTLFYARRLVAAASVAAISRDLSQSARRAAEAPSADLTGLTGLPTQLWTACAIPTRAELEKALLAIEAFPRCALLLTVMEGLCIDDAVLLLNADEELVRGARNRGLLELVRNIVLGQGGHGVRLDSHNCERRNGD